MVVNHFGAVILALYQDAVFLVSHNGNILFDFCSAEKLLVTFTYDSVLLLFLNYVQVYHGKSAVNFDSINIFSNIVPVDVCFTCQSDLDSYFVLTDCVIVDLKFELLTDGMYAY